MTMRKYANALRQDRQRAAELAAGLTRIVLTVPKQDADDLRAVAADLVAERDRERPRLTPDIINGMSDIEYRAAEARIRRLAARQGLKLVKSRTRVKESCEYGGYVLADANNNIVACGAPEFCFGLDDVERALLEGAAS